MSIIYFTNNAATGSGSLYNAVKTARAGDVVAPDPTVFGVGERVEIDFLDILKVLEPITIDAAGTKLILTKTHISGNIPSYVLIDSVYSTVIGLDARGITFKGRVLIGNNTSTFRFYNCRFGGFPKEYHSVHTLGNCTIEMYDCALTCGYASAFYGISTKGKFSFTRCTIAANKTNVTSSARASATYVDCIDEPDLATAGFANVPTSLDDVDVTKLEEYDFTPLPSSPYATGATTAAGCYDLDGLERGRVLEDGSTVYALGAYECIDAAFWTGANSEGNPVDEPRFNSAAGWSSLRNATKGNLDAAPDKCVVVNKRVAFSDAPSITSLRIANASVSINSAGGAIQQINLDEWGELINSAAEISYLEFAEGAAYSGPWTMVNNARIKSNGSITINKSAQLNRLTIEEGATLELADGVLVGVENMSVNGGTIRANARAYLGVPKDEPVDAATFENIVIVERSARLTDFKAYSDVTGRVTFTVAALNTDTPVLIEELTPRGWATITTEGTSETTTQASYPGLVVYRACDGVNFLQDVAIVPLPVWITTAWAENRGGGEVAGGKAWKVGAWAVDPQTTN